MIGNRFRILGTALALTMLARPAFADAIDGDWCHSDGRHFSIRGPAIVTPDGKQTEGDYSRHAFNYVVPAPERDGGHKVFMTLLDENHVHVRQGEAAAANPETWVRCSPKTSSHWSRPPV